MDKTFCIFGDSVTQAAYIKSSWVELLRNYLENKYHGDFVNVFNLGIGGNTSDDILNRFNAECQSRQPTDIIFLFGVNDSGYFRTPDKLMVQEDRFIDNINNLILNAKTFCRNITFIGLALGDDSLLKPFPGSSKGKSYDIARVKKYNNLLIKISDTNSCRFISIMDKLDNNDFIDGLHPNDKGHLKMFDEIKKWF